VYGFVDPEISWQGHLGGLVTGLLIGALFLYTRNSRRRGLQIAGLVVLPIAFIVAMVAHALV
jgi:membrane associated rhomboid family serine protease